MKIMLASPLLHLTDLSHNLKTILSTMREAKEAKVDLCLFSEASLSGFEALSFVYKEDLSITLGLHGPEISEIRALAKELKLGVGFGFYENADGAFHSTYLVIDKEGDIGQRYHRASPGWKSPSACKEYREGRGPGVFSFEDKQLAVVICGDLWTDDLLLPIAELDPHIDALIWPVHVDIALEAWYEENHDYQDPDNMSIQAYAHQTSLMKKPVLFINSYVADEGRAKGGLYFFQKGRIIKELPMGEQGSLLFDL